MTAEEWGNVWSDYQEVSQITRLIYNTKAGHELMKIKWVDMLSWTKGGIYREWE